MSLPPPIRSVEYDPVSESLTVRFRVGSYVFRKVPATKAAAFTAVAAGGEEALNHFHAHIEGKYKSERIGQ